MNFGIDKQTLEELNLLGKFKQGSVYHLFNHVRTRGAEKLLDDMFRHPLTDENEINARSGIFRFFRSLQLSFPFDVQQISLMRDYMDSSASKQAAMVLAGMHMRKILSSLTRDERYKKNIQGLHAVIITLNKAYEFARSIPDTDHPYAGRIMEIRGILDQKWLEKLRRMDIYQSMSVNTIAFYEHLLKAKHFKEMENILQFIYETDVYISVSKVAADRGFGYAYALPSDANVFSAKDLSHPCITGAISNDVKMDTGKNVFFLTGANMAGKSTLMKSIGIAMYLAHMGFPVAAANLEFSVREGMYSSINVADNIGLGYSHFYAEVVRVKRAAEAAASGKRLLLMFDELFKGTNVKDAYDGTLAVTDGFSGYSQCLFIVSTHITEVGEALDRNSNIRFRYMPTVMEGAHPRYTYKLEEGITEDRQGMMIIRNEGILELLDAGGRP
ncbi:MutS-related protein [Pseudoflavitalea rhizosphaerae]|uniref:MutS-related protein n=1 Tax=Pseudoflavitalea rhizosphaerae TaxID=1884793 RepID=UPI000F8C377F|nr:DNA mismatch repair protein [Pseudoflavitalea rhizosphaerae]